MRGKLFHGLKWLLMGNSLPGPLVAIPEHDPVISIESHRAERYLQVVGASAEQLGERCEIAELRGRRYRGLRRQLKYIAPQATAARIELLHAYRVTENGRTCRWITFAFPETVREKNTSFEMDAIRQAVVIDLPVDLGEVLIRPERFTDVICELFENRDIDFEDHPVFSRKYFVYSDDEDHLRSQLPKSVREVLANRDGLVLRARGSRALLARDRKLNQQDATLLVETAFELLNIKDGP
jgi:hypothetical protein